MNETRINVRMSVRQLILPDAWKSYANQKIQEIGFLLPSPARARVMLDQVKQDIRCVVVLASNGLRLWAHSRSVVFQRAIDQCAEQLTSQVRKFLIRRHHFESRLRERRKTLKTYAFRPTHHPFSTGKTG